MDAESDKQNMAGRDMTEDDTSGRDIDTSHPSISVDEVAALFEAGGVSRSKRTIKRNCVSGYLECFKVETLNNERWVVYKDSAERRLRELQQISPDTSGHDMTRQDVSGHVKTQHDMSGHDMTEEKDNDEAELLREQIKKLEEENLNLKLQEAGKQAIITRFDEEKSVVNDRIEKERAQWMQALGDRSKQIGELEQRLLLLDEGPREHGQQLPSSAADNNAQGMSVPDRTPPDDAGMSTQHTPPASVSESDQSTIVYTSSNANSHER